jgi:hypothetical protein
LTPYAAARYRLARCKTPQINRENRENGVSINQALTPYAAVRYRLARCKIPQVNGVNGENGMTLSIWLLAEG